MPPITPNLRCNEQIRITPIRLIGENNEQIGVIETYEAMRRARETGLDLVEVAPNERPPVCRIMDYGKWKYAQKKNVRKHHEQQLKEVRMRPKTDLHDRQIKVKHAIEFLCDGDKVQFKMVFRGRERAHREIGFETFNSIITELADLVKVERPPVMDGRDMIMILAPNKAALDKAFPPKAVPPAKPRVDKPADAPPDNRRGGLEPGPQPAALPAATAAGASTPGEGGPGGESD